MNVLLTNYSNKKTVYVLPVMISRLYGMQSEWCIPTWTSRPMNLIINWWNFILNYLYQTFDWLAKCNIYTCTCQTCMNNYMLFYVNLKMLSNKFSTVDNMFTNQTLAVFLSWWQMVGRKFLMNAACGSSVLNSQGTRYNGDLQWRKWADILEPELWMLIHNTTKTAPTFLNLV